MATGWVVLIAVIALLVGAAGGFFLARKYMQDYFKKNPFFFQAEDGIRDSLW